MFDISFFRSNPGPFYALAHELYPGKYRPTLTHLFLRQLHERGLLLKVFTQNIDCLERGAGVPDERIVEAHGSFARQRCVECGAPFPDADMRAAVAAREVPHCPVPECNGLVKPDIVFFGEQLPEAFFRDLKLPGRADLAIVMGTSLKVHPFAMLPQIVEEGVPRLLINKERVGDLGSRPDDVVMLEECDEGVWRLVEKLGWMEEMEALWKGVHPDEPMKGYDREGKEGVEQEKKGRDEALEDEIEQLTKEVDESLKFSSDHKNLVNQELERNKLNEGKVAKETEDSKGESKDRSKEISNEQSENQPKSSNGTAGISSPKASEEKPENEQMSGGNLQHVFPHVDKKSAL